NDEKTKTDVAVKIESERSTNQQLFLEYRYYTLIHKQHRMPGFPFCYYFGPYIHSNALVLELLGPSLEDLFDLCHHKFSPLTVFEIAKQTCQITYSWSGKRILRPNYQTTYSVSGKQESYRNSSIYEYKHSSWKRRDDIEALCHMYFYFLRGTLPWQGLKTENLKERYQKICQTKIATTVEALSRGFPDEFASMLRYARQLNFDQTPKYDYLVQLIDIYMRKTNNVNHTPIFDWKPITDV
ncbi:LOW QUALITY PROTEIN: hypothetical protein MXB_4235, partial [Myxobolus squamalis]